ncbi:receptor-like protein 35 [Daucus carota subsp. sativus]|uniref:receptor-like protein 35 n=1 Tax=Daucus carota subsp. sativus TaxID=79200 RepID=UPI0030826D04
MGDQQCIPMYGGSISVLKFILCFGAPNVSVFWVKSYIYPQTFKDKSPNGSALTGINLFVPSLSVHELVSQDSTKMMVNVKCTETERQALLDVKRDLIDIMVVFLRGATATMAKIAASGVVLPVTSTLYLDLSHNEFAVPNPSFIGSLTELVHLDLSEAGFRGVVPDELGNLFKLNFLDLSSNTFELSHVPKFIASFSSLNYLDLSDNQFSGALPHQFGNLSKLQYLDISSNKLQGQIPNSFGLMVGITYLNLSFNHLQGVIPNSLHHLSSLRIVDFNHNSLTGNLQDLLFLLPRATLQKLWIFKNQLTGSLPDITRFSLLKELNVDSNLLNGYLPKVFEHKLVLQSLDLSNNYLQGPLPNFTRFPFLKNLALRPSPAVVIQKSKFRSPTDPNSDLNF